MPTNHLVICTATVVSTPALDEKGMYAFWADSTIVSGQNTDTYHLLMHAPITNDDKRIAALMEKYQVDKRFLFQGKFLFDDDGNPILREENGNPYATYDIVLNSANYLGIVQADIPDTFNCIFAMTITQDPEMRVTPSGTYLYQMSGVVNRSVKDDTDPSGWKNFPLWIRTTVWGEKNAETLVNKGFKKGMLVWLEGTPAPDKDKTGFIKPWEGDIKEKDTDGKDTGKTHKGWRTSFDVWANAFSIRMLNKGGGGSHSSGEFDPIPF